MIDDINFSKIDDVTADRLEEPFSEREVLETLESLVSEKAPGPDGLHMAWYKKCWPFMRHDIVAVLAEFHSNCFLYWKLNTTQLVLLPKKAGLKAVTDYMPISLVHGGGQAAI